MQKNFYALPFIFTLIAVISFQSCKKETPIYTGLQVHEYKHEAISEWNNTFLSIEKNAPGYRPGPAPRALAYLGLAAYEACINGMPEYKSIKSQFQGLGIPDAEANVEYHWPSVVNAVYDELMTEFFRSFGNAALENIKVTFQKLEAKYKSETTAAVYTRSENHGREVARAVWKWSTSDQVGHDYYQDPFKGYEWKTAFKTAGDWVPTDPGPGNAMFAYWGKARTFAITAADKLCAPPLAYADKVGSPLYTQAMEVYNTTNNLTYDQDWIAEFWSDDLVGLTFSPGPRWLAIATQVFSLEKCNLDIALYANVKVGLALNDAAVACWESKYYYNVERPESYIKRLIDPNWDTPLSNPITGQKGITPSFPAYPSGHSTMGAAAAEVLADIFGKTYLISDYCHLGRSEFHSQPRTFNSFYKMAEENALSRIYLGVHFRMDCESGLELGYLCGKRVNAMAFK